MTVHLPRLWRIMSTVSENHPGILRYGGNRPALWELFARIPYHFPKNRNIVWTNALISILYREKFIYGMRFGLHFHTILRKNGK